jgi:hypothetical protein
MVVDHAGGMHALGKRILGVSAAEIRARLSDLAKPSLPTVKEACKRSKPTLGSRKGNKDHSEMASDCGVETVRFSLEPPRAGDQLRCSAAIPVALRPVSPQTSVAPAPETSSQLLLVDSSFPCTEPLQLESVGPIFAALTPQITEHKEPPPESSQPENHEPADLASTLRRQFRAAVKLITGRTPKPQPKARRRREEDTARGFKLAAKKLFNRIAEIPILGMLYPPWNTFTWLHLWEYNHPANTHVQPDDGTQIPSSYLSPHL